MSTENDIDNNIDNNDSSSLADPADFNRNPLDFPLGFKKRHFPEVYPEYANTPSKRYKADSDEYLNYSSSPFQEKKESEC